MLTSLKNMLLRRKPTDMPAPRVPMESATAALAILREKTDDPVLARYIDELTAKILMDQLPLYAMTDDLGIRMDYTPENCLMVKIHDTAFQMISEMKPRPGKPDVSATAREGGRDIAELIDTMVRRTLILAEDGATVNRVAFYRLMMAQSQIIACIDKLTHLPPKKKGADSADSTPAA